MRPAALLLVRSVLVAGPVALAFATGGFTDAGRLVALGAVWACVAAAALAGDLPRARASWVAVGALAGLAGWVAITTTWAPLGDQAGDDAERVLLYLGAVVAGALVWRPRGAARVVEPLTAAGVVVVIAYALAGRAGVIPIHETLSAAGRLDQPITYWNGLGALAAVGLVLCCRIAGDDERAAALRSAAAASAVPLATALVLTYSRGALAALAGGVLVLLVLAPTWSQLRAVAICLEAGAVGALAGLAGDTGLAAVPLLMGLAAALAAWAQRSERDASVRLGRLRLPRRSGWIAVVGCCALVVVPVLAGLGDSEAPTGATASRFATAGTHRDEYWRVAVQTFREHPIGGIGTGGFAAVWQRERTIHESVRDAHSIELEALAELGIVGALLLALMAAGVTAAAAAVQRADPVLAAGPAAAVACWLLHASLDWDWELPAVSLPTLGLVAMLLARAPGQRAR
jgi:hypothetical protein